MSSRFVVRRMERGDVPAVLAIAQGLGEWFDAEGLARIERDLRSPSGYVAVRGSEVLGFVTWKPVEGDVAELSWMGILETEHRRGVGRALVAALGSALRPAGYRILEVSTVADNVDYEPYARTRRFYRAVGFTDHRVDPRYWGSGEDRYDRLVLRLDLARADHPSP